ncbi:hypothetical protein B0H17DRAFT_197953 [Mycena rosella]|uniref:Uncharacterized protein n=1 Tax=Mycena rosella TaxID=1033263 RepID=A0AAD7D2R5_MYCRO|nr:hypothetical protein B0H17DRAFT_197953 [Mycena rosella]
MRAARGRPSRAGAVSECALVRSRSRYATAPPSEWPSPASMRIDHRTQVRWDCSAQVRLRVQARSSERPLPRSRTACRACRDARECADCRARAACGLLLARSRSERPRCAAVCQYRTPRAQSMPAATPRVRSRRAGSSSACTVQPAPSPSPPVLPESRSAMSARLAPEGGKCGQDSKIRMPAKVSVTAQTVTTGFPNRDVVAGWHRA